VNDPLWFALAIAWIIMAIAWALMAAVLLLVLVQRRRAFRRAIRRMEDWHTHLVEQAERNQEEHDPS